MEMFIGIASLFGIVAILGFFEEVRYKKEQERKRKNYERIEKKEKTQWD